MSLSSFEVVLKHVVGTASVAAIPTRDWKAICTCCNSVFSINSLGNDLQLPRFYWISDWSPSFMNGNGMQKYSPSPKAAEVPKKC